MSAWSDAKEAARPAIPVTWQQLTTAKLLMKPWQHTEAYTLSQAAVAVGVRAADLDLALWRTLGGF